MRIKLGKSPFLRSLTEAPDDLFVMANSFEPRCSYGVSTVAHSQYRCTKAVVINYDSYTEDHRKIKDLHLEQIAKYLKHALPKGNPEPHIIQTYKYDVFAFYKDLAEELQDIDCRNITVDITTFTKCTLAVFLSLLRERFPHSQIRCVWTPALYGSSREITRGVKETFAVPGFGGIGWRRCKVLILFLGQEHDRSYSLWRAVDPDIVYLVASKSEYSSVRPRDIFETAKDISALVESKKYEVSAIDPREAHRVLTDIKEDLKTREYTGEVAVACLGTKMELIGIWNFWQEEQANRIGWSYVYASPKGFIPGKYTQDYYQELNEVDLLPN